MGLGPILERHNVFSGTNLTLPLTLGVGRSLSGLLSHFCRRHFENGETYCDQDSFVQIISMRGSLLEGV